MDPELGKARRFMQEKILIFLSYGKTGAPRQQTGQSPSFQFLSQRQPQSNEIHPEKMLDLVKRLEKGLFMTAATQEEYLNLDTLESRLHGIIKRAQMRNNNPQRSQFASSSSAN